MFKYPISTLLLICLIPFSMSALKELKGLRGTVCVTKVTQDSTIEDVTLAIDDGCGFILKTEGQSGQEITVKIKFKDLTSIYDRLGIVPAGISGVTNEYIL